MKPVSLEKDGFDKTRSEAERVLGSGGIMVAPTDTVYGIIGDATKKEVIEKIFAVKKRPPEKALPIFVRDVRTARKYAYVSDSKAKFLEKIWPGKVTVIFHHKEKLPGVLTGGLDTIGIRIPDYPFLSELLARLNFPLAQTSANVSGKPPAKNIEEVKRYFDGSRVKPDLVVDAGELASSPSTVIDFTGNEPKILRTGIVSKSELDRILDKI